jgi:hypothetical protein
MGFWFASWRKKLCVVRAKTFGDPSSLNQLSYDRAGKVYQV